MAYINREYIDLTNDSIESVRAVNGLKAGIIIGRGSAEKDVPGSFLRDAVKLGGEAVKLGVDISYFASLHRETTVPLAERTEDE